MQLKQKLEQSDRAILKAKSETVAECNALLRQKEDENEQLTLSLTQQTHDLETAIASNQANTQRIAALEQSQRDLQERSEKAEQAADALRWEVEKHKRLESDLRQLVEQSSSHYEEVKGELGEKERTIGELRKQTTELSDALKAAKERNDMQDGRMEELEREKEGLEERVREMETSMNEQQNTSSEMEKLAKELSEREKQIESMKAEEESRRHKFVLVKNKHDSELKAAKDQIQQLQALLRAQSNPSDAHSEADTLRQQLAEQQTTMFPRFHFLM